jgi:HEAT repeat protein
MHYGGELPSAREQEWIADLIQELDSAEWSAANDVEEQLVMRGAGAVLPLCHALSFGSGEQRWRAAKALGRIGDPRAVQALCASLAVRPETAPMRRVAAAAQGRPSREGLLRIEAAVALGRIGASEAVAPLCYALADPVDGVGWSAQQALIAVGEPAVVGLGHISSAPRPRARQLAAGALGALADLRGITPLCHLLTDLERDVRRSSAAALGHFAQLHPARELRGALVPLRRLLTLRHLAARDIQFSVSYRRTVEEAIAKIERAVPDLRSLPLPVQAPRAPVSTLPLPADF